MLSLSNHPQLAMTFPSLCCSRPSRAVLIVLIIAIATAVSAQPAERTFTVDVTGSGPDIILIPGLAGGGAVWDGTVARLASSHTLHVVTLAGFGGVAPVDASTQDGFLDIVRDELVAYVTSLDDPAIVAGHSLGGWTALRIGLAAPESIAQVVVVDALPFLAAAQDPTMTEARAAQMGAGMKQMMSLSPPDQFRVQQEMALAAMITDPDTAAAYLDVHASSDPATVAQAMYDMFTTDLRGDMAELMVPTLVLAAGAGYGGMDEAAVRALYEGQYGDGIRVEVVPESRHFIQLDQPDALAEHLRAGTGVTLDPSRLFMGTLEMNYAILQGTSRQPVGTATETFEMDGEALRWVLLQRTPQGEMVDTLWMHPKTLTPQRYRSQNPLPQTVRLDYGDAHVTGMVVRGDAETPIDTELANDVLDASAAGSLVPALTLAEGFETTLATFHYASGSSERSVRVVARETLSTVNGNREAWVVDETLATPSGQTLQPRTWVDAETGVRWKTEVEVGPGMIYEAVVRSVQPAR